MKVGLDVGSTTIKCVVLDDQNNIVYKSYERHLSQITEKMSELLTKVRDEVIHGTDAQITVSGSAGMGVAETCNLPFMQEVYATRIAIDVYKRQAFAANCTGAFCHFALCGDDRFAR